MIFSTSAIAGSRQYFNETVAALSKQHNLTFEGKLRGNICGHDNETVFLSDSTGKKVYAFQVGDEPKGEMYTSGYASLYNITDCTLVRFYVAY